MQASATNPTDRARSDGRQEALAELGEIASRMTHEIRNPLNAIRMQVAVIRNKLLKPDVRALEVARGQLDRLESEVMKLESLAKAFLEFGRPIVSHPEDLCVGPFLDEVIASARPALEEAGHSVLVQGCEDETTWVRIDSASLRQALTNLLSNALHAMGEAGQVRVRLGREGDDLAIVEVEDTGCGIPEEELPDLFLPFHGFSCGGQGLGLAMTKKIVEAAGGEVRVESRVGEGSSFQIVLPLVYVADGVARPL